MKKRIFRYIKHALSTIFGLVVIATLFGLYHGASLSYGDSPLRLDWNNEGPYVFHKNDSVLNVNYIKGNKEDGFYLDQKEYPSNEQILASCYFPIDSSRFNFEIKTDYETPKTIYNDSNKILAISDIESGYRTFRDFLINNNIIDESLNWTFGTGHLVLVGDFVDRGFSTTQVLWFIYKLEQDAKKQGGLVHFIIGNHELKNMHGNYGAASPKYNYVAAILGKTQAQLYDSNSIMGKWLASKNALEIINGNLFVHGGIHPDIADTGLSLDEVNQIIRTNYYSAYFPRTVQNDKQLILSSKTGPCWYRGYFRESITQKEVEKGLNAFNAKTVVVGHTIQSKINKQYNGKVIGIDVSHPKDYHKNWPNKKSEALLIEGDTYYRVLANGKKKII